MTMNESLGAEGCAQAAGMLPEESSGGAEHGDWSCSTAAGSDLGDEPQGGLEAELGDGTQRAAAVRGPRETNGACAVGAPGPGMVSEASSERAGEDESQPHVNTGPGAGEGDLGLGIYGLRAKGEAAAELENAGEQNKRRDAKNAEGGEMANGKWQIAEMGSGALRRSSYGERMTREGAAFFARRAALWEGWERLRAAGHSYKTAAPALGVGEITLWRLIREVSALEGAGQAKERAFEAKRGLCGGKPGYRPNAEELACVREIYVRLDESVARGRGLGSSRVVAYRLAAKSDDPRIGEEFRRMVLKRKRKTVPPSWERLLDVPASVLARARDKRSTMASYVSTPRNRTWVNGAGKELPLRAGTIFEADDGTFNFYAWIPWPFGGDRCSDNFGVKLGRWQMLAVVDAHSEFCCAFDVVARNFGSYRGEDSGALLGRTMAEVGRPGVWRLERGSWESNFVRRALELCQVPVRNAWHSKQKSAVERFFDRFWTPASLIAGHCGRDRGRFKQITDLALACQDARRDPREKFLSLSEAMGRVIGALEFVNGEPIESKSWGRWVPQERFESQFEGRKLEGELSIFFSREQREWTVRGCAVGGNVEGPLIRFPVYFQCHELWEFEGCKVRCYFDPYAEPVVGTIVLADEWRGCKAGHVIARGVPALERPPQIVLAAEGWARNGGGERSLAVRKAIAKAVRTECWNWMGGRKSEARDGMGAKAEIRRRGADRGSSNGRWQIADGRGENDEYRMSSDKGKNRQRERQRDAGFDPEDMAGLGRIGAGLKAGPGAGGAGGYAISAEEMNEL